MRKLSKTQRIRMLLKLSASKSPMAIAKMVRCTPSYVYRIRKEAEQKARRRGSTTSKVPLKRAA